MDDTRKLVEALKRVTRMRGLTYAQLATQARLSEATVKRLFSQGTFTLQRLEQFCALLDVDFQELARLASGADDEARELSLAQETALAADERLLAVFYLVYSGWKAGEIVAHYRLSTPQCTALLLKLDRLGLIELLPENRVRLRLPRGARLRPDGPLRRKHGARLIDDFLAPRFDRAGGWFAFEFRDLSRASMEVIRRKLERLAAEFHDLAELDANRRAAERTTIGLALGVRPWSLVEAVRLPRRAPAGREGLG
jgi:DNA-binding Xre family transcriptional regulator